MHTKLHQNFDSAGLVAAEVMKAVASRVDVLDIDCLGRDVQMIEPEMVVRDKAAVAGLDVVQLRAAGAGDDEARRVALDLKVLQDMAWPLKQSETG